MHFRSLVIRVCAMLSVVPSALYAQPAPRSQPPQDPVQQQLKQLEDQFSQLGKQGKLPEAMTVAQSALKLSRATYGAEDERVAKPLFMVCIVSHYLKKYSDAEQYCSQSLAVEDKNSAGDD